LNHFPQANGCDKNVFHVHSDGKSQRPACRLSPRDSFGGLRTRGQQGLPKSPFLFFQPCRRSYPRGVPDRASSAYQPAILTSSIRLGLVHLGTLYEATCAFTCLHAKVRLGTQACGYDLAVCVASFLRRSPPDRLHCRAAQRWLLATWLQSLYHGWDLKAERPRLLAQQEQEQFSLALTLRVLTSLFLQNHLP
jgi:hypothetical protein